MENFDFSKKEDQEKFDLASPETRRRIIDAAQTEANLLKEMVESGEAKDYFEALKKMSEGELNYEGFSLYFAPNGDVFLDIGGGKELMGNTLEGAITESDGITSVDVSKSDENLARILKVIDAFVIEKSSSDKIN